jgi:hypothetical protein
MRDLFVLSRRRRFRAKAMGRLLTPCSLIYLFIYPSISLPFKCEFNHLSKTHQHSKPNHQSPITPIIMFGLRRQLVNPTGIRRTIASSHDHRSLHVSAILRASADMQITRGRIQMYRIKEMLERVSGTNRPREKVAIVKEYEDLRPVIEL